MVGRIDGVDNFGINHETLLLARAYRALPAMAPGFIDQFGVPSSAAIPVFREHQQRGLGSLPDESLRVPARCLPGALRDSVLQIGR